MITMKKTALILAAVLMICSFAACGQKDEPKKDDEVKAAAAWILNDDETLPNASEDALEALNKAMEEYVGMDFECIAHVGNQVVAGQNLMFLCKGTPVVPDAETKLVMVTVYRDLEGNCTITNAVDFDLKELEETLGEETPEGLVGGWAVRDDYLVVNLPADAEKALEATGGAEPLALLATDGQGGYAVLAMEDGQISVVFAHVNGSDIEAAHALVNLAGYNN